MTTTARDDLRRAATRFARVTANCVALTAMSCAAFNADVLWSQVVPTEAPRSAGPRTHRSSLQFCYSGKQGQPLPSHHPVQSLVVQAMPSRELDQGQTFVAVADENIVPAGVGLAFPCCPTAVTGFVVPVRVDAVQRVTSRWPQPDVSQKGRKVIQPLRAHLDSPASPIMEAQSVRVVTPRLGVIPRSVFRGNQSRFSTADCRPVLQAVPSSCFQLEAPATLRSAFAQSVTKHDTFFAAVASTQPLRMTARAQVSRQCDKPAKPYPGQVIKFHSYILPHRVCL